MKTFCEYITEDWAPPTSKGWMSPSGKVHTFDPKQEHAQNWHPSDRGPRGVHSAMKRGFVRFGSHVQADGTSHHFIHYSEYHPKGKQTALRALDYLKPNHDDYVTMTGERTAGPDAYKKGRASEFAGSVGPARASLRSSS